MEILRRSRWFVLLPLVGVTSTGLIAATRPAPKSGCETIAEWVKTHRAELPTTYAEIIRYPVGYRKKIQGVLPAAVHRAMWHAQYRFYRESGFLNESQRQFLTRAELTIDVLLDSATSLARKRIVSDSITSAAIAILGRDLTHDILFVLGPDTTLSASSRSLFQYALAHPVRVPQVDDVNCTCHVLGVGGGASPPECNSPLKCNLSNCRAITPGCGTNGAFACNGLCET